MKFLVVLASVVLVAKCFSLDVDVKLRNEEFEKYKLQFNKTYPSMVEEQVRREIFYTNLRDIEEHNQLYELGLESYLQGVNQFTDLTQEEFAARNTLRIPQEEELNMEMFVPDDSIELPASIDWQLKGAVTPVKDQGFCGSCWAFSTTGAIEGAYYLKNKHLKSFSEQQLVDCDRKKDKGCGGGLPSYAFQYVKQHGITTETQYPYTGEAYEKCRYKDSMAVTKVNGYKQVSPADLDKALATVGPISVLVNGLPLQHYSQGVAKFPECQSIQQINHAVLLVGYGEDNGQKFWRVKNSWAETWGEDGYFRLLRSEDSDPICIRKLPTYPYYTKRLL